MTYFFNFGNSNFYFPRATYTKKDFKIVFSKTDNQHDLNICVSFFLHRKQKRELYYFLTIYLYLFVFNTYFCFTQYSKGSSGIY